MPLNLITPVPVTDPRIDGVASYPQLKIVRQSHDPILMRIEIICQYGNTINDVWTPGVLSKKTYTIRNWNEYDADGNVTVSHTDYTDMVSELSLLNESVYAGAKRLLYQWLIDKGHETGVVV